jgi:sentrin-specific protease 1
MVSNDDERLCSTEPSRKRSQIFSVFFHVTLMAEGVYSYESVAGWPRAVGIFELFDKILIPINVDNTHWIAAMVSMTEKCIQIYDPLGQHHTNARLYFDRILRFLGDEHLNQKGGVALPEASSWRLVLQDPHLPTQPNDYDCGVFVSAFIYFTVLNLPFRRAPGGDPHLFAANLRYQFARSIMTSMIHF